MCSAMFLEKLKIKIEQWNPYSKLFTYFFLLLSLLFIHNYFKMILYFFILISIVSLSNRLIESYLTRIWSQKWFYIALTIICLISGLNVLNSVIIVLRVMCFEIIILTIYESISFHDLCHILESLLEPVRKLYLHPRTVTFYFISVLYFFPILIEELEQINKQKRKTKSFYFRFYLRCNLFLMAFQNTIKRLRTWKQTLEKQSYFLYNKRTCYKKMEFHIFDIGMLIFSILTFIFIV